MIDRTELACHAQHMRSNDEHERQGRQGRDVEPFAYAHALEDRRKGGEPGEIDREKNDENVAYEKLRHRDRDKSDDVRKPVRELAFAKRRQNAESDPYRHGKHRRVACEKKRIEEARPELLEDVALIRQRDTEIAMKHAEKPAEVADISGLIETKLLSEDLQTLRRRLLAKNGRSDIPGKNLRYK